MKTEYEKQVSVIDELCSDINWEADHITDILCARDYVAGLADLARVLRSIDSQLEKVCTELNKRGAE